MKFKTNGAFYTLDINEEEKKAIEEELENLNAVLNQYDLGYIPFEDFKYDIEKLADKKQSIDLGYLLNEYFISSFYAIIDTYNLENNKKADQVKQDLEKSDCAYYDLSNSLTNCIENIEEKFNIKTEKPLGYIDEKKLRNMITANHTFSNKNLAFKYYVKQELIDRESGKNKRAFASQCKKNVETLLSDEIEDVDPKEVLYNIALNYRCLKQTHDKGLKFFNFFSWTWHKERKALNKMETLIRDSKFNPILNKKEVNKELFIHYCKTGEDGNSLGLADFDTLIYSPMIVGMVHEKVFSDVTKAYERNTIIEVETRDDNVRSASSDEVSVKSISVDELKNESSKSDIEQSFSETQSEASEEKSFDSSR